LGLVSGATVGALAGSAFPRWKFVWGDRLGEGEQVIVLQSRTGLPTPKVFGGFGLGIGGSGVAGGEGSAGFAWQGQLFHRVGDFWIDGLEFAWAQPGTAAQRPGWSTIPYRGHTSLWHAGWRAEITPWTFSSMGIAPYAVFGLAFYSWQDSYLGGSSGLGLRFAPESSSLGCQIEARRHDNISRLVETDPAHWTMTVSVLTRW